MATSTLDPRMAFRAQQQDPGAPIPRQLILRYFYESSTMELMEAPSGRLYLKRTPIDLPASAFTVGATLMLFGKATTLTAYADEVTRQLCAQNAELTTVIIAEDVFPSLGRYLAILAEECRFAITDVELVWVRAETVAEFDLPEQLTNSRIVVALCSRDSAVEKGFDFVERASGTCTAKDTEQAATWARLAQLAKKKPLAVFNEPNSSIVVLKPHLIRAGQGGSAMQQLLDAGLEPTALTTVTMSSAAANEFMEAYRGVLPDLEGTVGGFVGTSWVLQVVSLDELSNVVELVRGVCGPYDTVIAKKLAPTSIRARYGLSEVQNAVHCCDLPTDGPIYANFFFHD